MFEPSFKERDFQRWKAEGKIDDSKIAIFRQLSIFTGVDKPTVFKSG
jgi:hypothetical protein